MRRRLPNIPLVCDPSHICGDRGLISLIAQRALDLGYDGLMIEVHHDPTVALTDAKQQLDPVAFDQLVGSLIRKRNDTHSDGFLAGMDALRREVDELDQQVVTLLAARMEIVRRMGALKREHAISVFQPERWEAIITSRIEHGREHRLADELIFRIFELIHQEAIIQQRGISSGTTIIGRPPTALEARKSEGRAP